MWDDNGGNEYEYNWSELSHSRSVAYSARLIIL